MLLCFLVHGGFLSLIGCVFLADRILGQPGTRRYSTLKFNSQWDAPTGTEISDFYGPRELVVILASTAGATLFSAIVVGIYTDLFRFSARRE
jgi:hypothetical protein